MKIISRKMSVRNGRGPSQDLRFGAFTLVELLVVISIVALLMSVLLPSLRAARKRAEALKCSVNIRQMGQASLMYANDFKMYLPMAINVDTSFSYVQETLWAVKLIPYMNQSVKASQLVTKTPGNEWWFCPEEVVQGSWNYANFGMNSTVAGKQSNGAWSNGTLGSVNGTWPKPITIVRKTATSFLISEFKGTAGNMEYMANFTSGHANQAIRFRHMGSANIVFFDGHVEMVKDPGAGNRVPRIAMASAAAGDFTRRLWE